MPRQKNKTQSRSAQRTLSPPHQALACLPCLHAFIRFSIQFLSASDLYWGAKKLVRLSSVQSEFSKNARKWSGSLAFRLLSQVRLRMRVAALVLSFSTLADPYKTPYFAPAPNQAGTNRLYSMIYVLCPCHFKAEAKAQCHGPPTGPFVSFQFVQSQP